MREERNDILVTIQVTCSVISILGCECLIYIDKRENEKQ